MSNNKIKLTITINLEADYGSMELSDLHALIEKAQETFLVRSATLSGLPKKITLWTHPS